MAMLQDIENQKNAAVATVNAKIADASAKEAAAASEAEQDRWDGVIEKLNAKRDEIIDQAYQGETGAPEIQQAVDALKAATDELNQVSSSANHASVTRPAQAEIFSSASARMRLNSPKSPINVALFF